MEYNQYLRLMNFVGGFYDFHPEYFSGLTADDRDALSKVFLYDYDDTHDNDDDFPASVENYFRNTVVPNAKTTDCALAAIAKLYSMSGMGQFRLEDISTDKL